MHGPMNVEIPTILLRHSNMCNDTVPLLYLIMYSSGTSREPGKLSKYSESLRVGRAGNPGGGEIFRTRPDRPWGPPIFLYN